METIQRQRLEAVGKRLINIKAREAYEHFNMGTFLTHHSEDVEYGDIAKTCYCGTVACVAGHAALMYPKEIKGALNWSDIPKILFGISTDNYQFNYLFSAAWEAPGDQYYGTPWAAADRIFYYLDDVGRIKFFDNMKEAEGYCVEKGLISKASLAQRYAYYKKLIKAKGRYT
jgi:hypothetical protein